MAPWMLVVTALVVLVGIGVMFYITVQEVNKRVDDVNGQIDRSVNQLRTDVRKELDARIPAGAAGISPIPTPDPLAVPTETPTPDPFETTPTPTPTTEPGTTPDASATETPTEEPEIINP